jgi:hypothetical protein
MINFHPLVSTMTLNYGALTPAQQAMVVSDAAAAGINWGGNFNTPDVVHFYNDPGNRSQLIQDAQQRYQNGSANGCSCGH